MPDERPAAPAPSAINLRQRLAEGQHAVVAVEIEAPDSVGIAHRAMMGVVEQQREPTAAPTHRPDGGHQPGVVPFMHDHEVGVGQGCVEIEAFVVGARREFWVGRPIGVKPGFSMILEQVLQAPRLGRLVGRDCVAAMDEFAQHTAQEVRVAVVPAGGERVSETDDPHAAAPWDWADISGMRAP